MPIDSQRVQAVFLAAVEEAGAGERSALLDRLCGGEAELRQRVEALLRAHDAPDDDMLAPTSTGWQGEPDTLLLNETPGSVIGSYRLLEQIGEGGFAVVFMAEQTQPVRRKVALKVLKPGMDSRQVIARFEAERQALAMMDHPNIASVFDGGVAPSGRPYFVMELVKGAPITEFCDEHSLTLAERLSLFISVCLAVQHAHQKGIIHRDLKPSNVLVTAHDTKSVVKVIDFGVAKALGQELTDKTLFTGFAQMIGTPLYMSPEQAGQSGLDIDTRSDIYSLGVLLYELVTGATPFSQERFQQASYDEVCRILREEDPPKPSTRLSQLRSTAGGARKKGPVAHTVVAMPHLQELDWIVMKTLEKDRTRRYATANGLAADVQRYLNDEPVQACPPSAGYRLTKFVRRNQGPVLAALLISLALVAGIIGTTWGMIRARAANLAMQEEVKQKETALESALKHEREANDKLWLSLYERARAGRFSRQPGQRLASLAAVAEAAHLRPDARLRDEAAAAMALPDVGWAPAWRSSSSAVPRATAYSPHYRLYARVDEPGNISIRSLPDDREIQRIATGVLLGNYLYFSPDERFLLVLEGDYKLRVWRVADGSPVLDDELRDCRAHAFSPDGKQLAIGQRDSVLCFDLETGREITRWRIPAPAHSLAFHPNNERLAVGYLRLGVASVYHVASGALLGHLQVGEMSNQIVAWHPDGERLAVSGGEPKIQIWYVQPKRKVAVLEGHVQQVETLTFHPHADLLASHSWDGALRLWDVSAGRALLTAPLMAGVRPHFSSDGRWLAATLRGQQGELLEVTASREYRTLANKAGITNHFYNQGDISPDGRLLVLGANPGARIWDLKSGGEIAALPPWTVYAFFDCPRSEGDSAAPTGSAWSLLTCGNDGLQRWPITSDDPQAGSLRLGPPQPLSPLRRAWFTRNPTGRTLAAVTEVSGVNRIFDVETGATLCDLGKHPDGEVRALSPDGRWAASSGWHSDRVRLWKLASSEMVQEWVVGMQTEVFFTRDSAALVISRGDELSFWDVNTLKLVRRLPRDVAQFPGRVAFSPDGTLMAVEIAPAVIHLQETATGRTVARLEDPYGDRATWVGFAPGGDQLVTVARFANAVHVWDLRTIRSRLKEMNLDWDWPEFAPPADEGFAAKPISVQVVHNDGSQPVLTPTQRAEQYLAEARRNFEANSESPANCNALAWAYLMAPEAQRDVPAAVRLAEKAMRLKPDDVQLRNTLGAVYYRAGRYREAADALQTNVDRLDDWGRAMDLYFLAMSRHRLGETAQARIDYEHAVQWVQAKRELAGAYLDNLMAFRAEAAEVLGIQEASDANTY